MMTFLHFFSLMIGDLVPDDDPVWLFYLNFLEIVDILLSNQIKNNSIDNSFRTTIKKHHLDYV